VVAAAARVAVVEREKSFTEKRERERGGAATMWGC
jgi:hypothetical protein